MTRGPIQSVGKALTLLEEIAKVPGGARITDLAAKLRWDKSTVSRLVTTLENHHFVGHARDSQRYTLGIKIFQLGSQALAAMPFKEIVKPFLDSLRDRTGETALALAIAGDERVVLEMAPSKAPLRVEVELGSTTPLQSDAAGRCLLAFQDADASSRSKRSRPNEKKPTSKTWLKRSRDIRERGYDVDIEGWEPGVVEIAVPVATLGGVHAALAILVPAQRHSPKTIPSFIKQMKQAATDIAAKYQR